MSEVKTVDLLDGAKDGEDLFRSTVALFKEVPENPRLLADSDHFIAYTLNNSKTLRIVCRANNHKGALKHDHTIHAVKFVNYRSNVGATAANNEFYVWVVTDDVKEEIKEAGMLLTVKIYFKLKDDVVINNFSFFINSTVGMPDLFILYDKKVAMLESSKLIKNFGSENETQAAKLPDDSKELRQLSAPTNTKTLCCINNGGWFAFNSTDVQVIASTIDNRSTPAWKACEGENILGLELLNMPNTLVGNEEADKTAQLLANSSHMLFQWKLSADAEPQLMRRFTFGESLVTIRSSHRMLALFNSDMRVAFIEFLASSDKFNIHYTTLSNHVQPTSVCFCNQETYSRIFLDASSQIETYQVPHPKAETGKASNHKENIRKSAPSPSATVGTKQKATTPASIMHADPSILSAVPSKPAGGAEQVYPAPTTTTSYAPAASAAPTAQAANAAAIQQARAALQNRMLPQITDGPIAAAVFQGDESVRKELDGLQNLLKNIEQVLQLTPEQLDRDHQLLINLALEAQMTELQNAELGRPAGETGGRSGVDKQANEAFTSYTVTSLLMPVANDIALGVTRGIHETLRTQLDVAVKSALGDNMRDSQKEALKRRLDEALKESTTFFTKEVARKIESFAQHELQEALKVMNGTVSRLMEENRKLQVALRDVMALNVSDELSNAREEVRQARLLLAEAGGAAGGAGEGGSMAKSSFTSRPAPETVLTTSTGFFANKQFAQGLEYLVLGQHPQITFDVLHGLQEDIYSSLIEQPREVISDSLWTSVLLLLLKDADKKLSAKNLEELAQVLFDVFSERDNLTSSSNASGQKLLSDVRHFIVVAKEKLKSAKASGLVKTLEKVIQQ